ncbi:hypothetical protein TanjilG_02886 [Lupinus angustifolius]|uniref:Uncharacterized protein n=1 Tax=Lupinus angustifolius TaxID=3871 RepID=A0A4P1QP98_LUPAN|nr:hypothetical protein TanjilG_02886 [Lupinus angustifolius]
MLILFEALEVDYVLCEDSPVDTDIRATPFHDDTPIVTPLCDGTKKANEEAKKKYEKDNKTIWGYLLTHMANNLFDFFINQKSTKVIWETLVKHYNDDGVGKKKYVVGELVAF